MASKSPRRAGAPWRLQVHEWPGMEPGMYGACHNVFSTQSTADRSMVSRDKLGDYPGKTEESVTVLPGTEFDELVVGRWLHIEAMDTGYWWMNIGGVTVNVTADRDGRPKHVSVCGPGDYDDPVEGCRYELVWTGEE